jgi:hypothetical protein
MTEKTLSSLDWTPPRNPSDLLSRLKARSKGHFAAYRDLTAAGRPARMERIYSDFSEKEWREVLRENPGDWLALHHLAILHHARAFDREAEGDAAAAKTDWMESHALWHRLLEAGEPVTSISRRVQHLDTYQGRAEEYEKKLSALKTTLTRALLDIHKRLYGYYIDLNRETDADIHLSVVERAVPFFGAVAKQTVQDMYEWKFGNRVAALSARLKPLHRKKKTALAGEFTEMFDRIEEIVKRRDTLAAAYRDLVIVNACRMEIEFRLWQQEWDRVYRDIEPKINRVKRMENDLVRERDEIERKQTQGADFTLVARIDAYNRKVREFESLRNQIIRQREDALNAFAAVDIHLERIEKGLKKLTMLRDTGCLAAAREEVMLYINGILTAAPAEGLLEEAVFERFQRRWNAVRGILNRADDAGAAASPPSASLSETEGPWTVSVGRGVEENPYRNSWFLLLESELPADLTPEAFPELIRKIKLKKKKLETKAKSGKHEVLGKTIKLPKLNTVRLDDPLKLAMHMLIHHPAHHADFTDIADALAEIEPPAPESIPLQLTKNAYRYLTYPRLPESTRKRWEFPEYEPAPPPKPVFGPPKSEP